VGDGATQRPTRPYSGAIKSFVIESCNQSRKGLRPWSSSPFRCSPKVLSIPVPSAPQERSRGGEFACGKAGRGNAECQKRLVRCGHGVWMRSGLAFFAGHQKPGADQGGRCITTRLSFQVMTLDSPPVPIAKLRRWIPERKGCLCCLCPIAISTGGWLDPAGLSFDRNGRERGSSPTVSSVHSRSFCR